MSIPSPFAPPAALTADILTAHKLRAPKLNTFFSIHDTTSPAAITTDMA